MYGRVSSTIMVAWGDIPKLARKMHISRQMASRILDGQKPKRWLLEQSFEEIREIAKKMFPYYQEIYA